MKGREVTITDKEGAMEWYRMAQVAVVMASCAVALPSLGKNVGSGSTAVAGSKDSRRSTQASVAAQSSKPKASGAADVKPNFYTTVPSASKVVKKEAERSASRRRSTASSQKMSAPKANVAGKNSVRRLEPTESQMSDVAFSPVTTQAPQSQHVASQPVKSVPDLSPTHVSADARKSRWARLNPLTLFESRRPKLVPTGYVQTGIASWYGSDFHGGPTASGERYDMTSLTAAHPSLPFGTLLRVTNLRNGREVVVRVNNRGPFHRNRIIDLSKEAARQLGMVGSGLAKVQVEVLQAVEPIGNWGQQAMRKLAGQ
jgi:rare lipoprotein A